MDKKTSIILLVIGGLFFLILGGGLGIFYQSQKNALQTPEGNSKLKAVQVLSSKVIPSITAYGQVSNIDGRSVTLTFGGDSLNVKINDDAVVYLPSSESSPQQIAKFEDIKKGDNVSVNLRLLPDGQIEGQMVIILNPVK